MKKHTFAIIAYKESPYLQECIDSLKNQSSESEIILCTSTPSKFLERTCLENGIKIHINPKQDGIASDWNFALNAPETQYVTLAHQDDVYHKDYAQKIVEHLTDNEDSLFAFTSYEELLHSKNGVRNRRISLNFLIKYFLNSIGFCTWDIIKKNKSRLLIFGNPIGCPTVTFNKETIGNFQFNSNFTVNLDWDAWHNLSQRSGSFIWIRKILVAHRIHEESETSNGLRENRRQEEDLLIFKRMWPASVAILLSYLYKLSYNNNK